MTIAYTVFKSNLYSFDHLHEMTMYCGISIIPGNSELIKRETLGVPVALLQVTCP